MSRALKSAFYRFFRTKWFLKVLVFSLLTGLIIILNTVTTYYAFVFYKRPRYLDRSFLSICMIGVMVILPFLIAIFCTSFTGNDLNFRSVNNKVATGISRKCIYLADLTVVIVGTVIGFAVTTGVIFAYYLFCPTRGSQTIDAHTIRIVLYVLITCIAFAAFNTLMQYFFSNKLFALIVTILIIPCIIVCSQVVEESLYVPYRYYVENEETGEGMWVLNPEYVGGTPRKVLTFVYDTIPFGFQNFSDEGTSKFEKSMIAGAIVVTVTTAAGMEVFKKRELS